ncbi:hypothetical protein Tco_1242668, partial [Tanacetum coccineum]
MKDVVPTKEVNNSNLCDVLNSVENNIDLDFNGKVTLVDDEDKLLEKVDSSGDHDSEDEVKLVDNEMASFRASKKVGYGSISLPKQWKKTYENDDYDYDPYNDDLFVSHEIPDKIQSIYDNLDIK